MVISGADELRDWAARRGFSQVEAADYIGVSESFYSLLVNGKHRAGLTLALRIHDRTGIPVQVWADTEPVASDR